MAETAKPTRAAPGAWVAARWWVVLLFLLPPGAALAFLYLGWRARYWLWMGIGAAEGAAFAIFAATNDPHKTTVSSYLGIASIFAWLALIVYGLVIAATGSFLAAGQEARSAKASDRAERRRLKAQQEHEWLAARSAAIAGRKAAWERYPALLDQIARHGPSTEAAAEVESSRASLVGDRRLQKVEAKALAQYLDRVLADDRLTPTEEDELHRVMALLGHPKVDPQRFTRIQIATINDGRLPSVNPPGVIPKADESFYRVFGAGLLKEVTSVRYKGRSRGVSVPIGFGLRYRTGSYRGRRIVDTKIQTIDRGPLILSNQRILFVGRSRSTIEIPLAKLVAVDAGATDVALHSSNRQKASYFRLGGHDQLDLFLAILNAAVARKQG